MSQRAFRVLVVALLAALLAHELGAGSWISQTAATSWRRAQDLVGVTKEESPAPGGAPVDVFSKQTEQAIDWAENMRETAASAPR